MTSVYCSADMELVGSSSGGKVSDDVTTRLNTVEEVSRLGAAGENSEVVWPSELAEG